MLKSVLFKSQDEINSVKYKISDQGKAIVLPLSLLWYFDMVDFNSWFQFTNCNLTCQRCKVQINKEQIVFPLSINNETLTWPILCGKLNVLKHSLSKSSPTFVNNKSVHVAILVLSLLFFFLYIESLTCPIFCGDFHYIYRWSNNFDMSNIRWWFARAEIRLIQLIT